MKSPTEPPLDDTAIAREVPTWQPAPGASSHPGQSLRWAWLKVLALGFLLALAVGLIGLSLDELCA